MYVLLQLLSQEYASDQIHSDVCMREKVFVLRL